MSSGESTLCIAVKVKAKRITQCVYMCVPMCIVYIWLCVCGHVCICGYVCVFVCGQVCSCVCVVDMCAHVYVCYMSVSVCICVFMSVYTCAYVRVNMLPVCFCQCCPCVCFCVSVCRSVCMSCECACECVCSCLCVCVCKHTLGCDSWKPTLSGRHPNSPRSRLLWSALDSGRDRAMCPVDYRCVYPVHSLCTEDTG